MYDKSGSVVISGYDDYYLVEEDGEKFFLAAHDAEIESEGWDRLEDVTGDWYTLDGEKLGKFKAAYDEDERLESYLRDRDYKVHEF